MKKGILTTLLLASGAALAVYLLKEEQDKKIETDDEKRMIKIRSDEEDKELVRTIQEIESLPIGHNESEIDEDNIIESNFLNDFQLTPDFHNDADDFKQDEIKEEVDIPSFINPSMTLSETDFDDLINELPFDITTPMNEENIQVESVNHDEGFEVKEDPVEDYVTSISEPEVEFSTGILSESSADSGEKFVEQMISDTNEDSFKYMLDKQFPNASHEILEELSIPSFESIVSPTKLADEILKPIFDEEEVEFGVETHDSNDTNTSIFRSVELPTLSLPKVEEDDMSKTAVFDLPSSFKSVNASLNSETHMKAPINPFDDDLEEIDLSELFEKMDEEDAVDFSALFEDTSEMKLEDIDENEIKKLFSMDNQDDLEEIHLDDDLASVVSKETKKELTEEEFEDFRKRLVHMGEDDIDLINFNDDKPFETTNHLSDEIDIINFGNIVEEPTIALEDLVLDKPIELLAQENSEKVETEVREIVQPDVDTQAEIREYPNAIYDIHKLYPFLNLKFINAVFNNFDDFISEFKVGSNCKIIHRVQFPDAQKLISFIEITKEYGYEIVGTDDDHNILLTLEFVNEESKILSEIYNISNQVNCLDGLYRGYELEHI